MDRELKLLKISDNITNMSTTIDIHELSNRFAEILSLASTGTEIIVTEGRIPRARLVSLPIPTEMRRPDMHPGAITTTEDFDDPLPDSFWTGEA